MWSWGITWTRTEAGESESVPRVKIDCPFWDLCKCKVLSTTWVLLWLPDMQIIGVAVPVENPSLLEVSMPCMYSADFWLNNAVWKTRVSGVAVKASFPMDWRIAATHYYQDDWPYMRSLKSWMYFLLPTIQIVSLHCIQGYRAWRKACFHGPDWSKWWHHLYTSRPGFQLLQSCI